MVKHIEVIADNGGGFTLQVGKRWRHMYDSRRQLARDLWGLARGDNPLMDWEGNQAEKYPHQEYDYEDVRSGGYRWYRGSPQVVIREIMGERSGWASVRELGDALRAMAPARVASKPRARRAKAKPRLSK